MTRITNTRPGLSEFDIELHRIGTPAAYRLIEAGLPKSPHIPMRCAVCQQVANTLHAAGNWFEKQGAYQPA